MENRQINLETAISNIGTVINSFIHELDPIFEGLSAWVQAERFRSVLGAAGWLPHHTTPLQIVADCEHDVETIRTRIGEYYNLNWPAVRSAIEVQMAGYDVDDEARETFREALDAHACGLYRCVPRTLFPEIDRQLRIHVTGSKTGQGLDKTTIRGLFDDKNKSIWDFLPGGWLQMDYVGRLTRGVLSDSEQVRKEPGFGLFQYVHEHELKRLESDPVPNRHASIHGYVGYSSAQNSLNAIFVADYIFQLISSLEDTPQTRIIVPAMIDLQPFRDRLDHLDAALYERAANPDNDFLRDSVVLRFTFAFDAAASALREYLLDRAPMHGSKRKSTRRCLREAVNLGLITDGSAWMIYADHRDEFDRASNAEAIATNASVFAADAKALLNAMEQGIPDNR